MNILDLTVKSNDQNSMTDGKKNKCFMTNKKRQGEIFCVCHPTWRLYLLSCGINQYTCCHKCLPLVLYGSGKENFVQERSVVYNQLLETHIKCWMMYERSIFFVSSNMAASSEITSHLPFSNQNLQCEIDFSPRPLIIVLAERNSLHNPSMKNSITNSNSPPPHTQKKKVFPHSPLENPSVREQDESWAGRAS